MSELERNGRLWIRLMKKHRMMKSVEVPCSHDDPQGGLRRALPALDLSQPLWLPRHQADWDEYSLTRFLPDQFLEPVPFDFMEISYLYASDEKKPARRRSPIEDA